MSKDSAGKEAEELKKAKAEVRDLIKAIVGHYKEIERLRDEDRRRWREFSERMEGLEEVKSTMGKRGGGRRRTKEQVEEELRELKKRSQLSAANTQPTTTSTVFGRSNMAK